MKKTKEFTAHYTINKESLQKMKGLIGQKIDQIIGQKKTRIQLPLAHFRE